MSRPVIPPKLGEALAMLAIIEPAESWADFAMRGRVNVMRYLRKRKWIDDIGETYQDGEPYTGPKKSQFVLTPGGREALAIFLEPRSPR